MIASLGARRGHERELTRLSGQLDVVGRGAKQHADLISQTGKHPAKREQRRRLHGRRQTIDDRALGDHRSEVRPRRADSNRMASAEGSAEQNHLVGIDRIKAAHVVDRGMDVGVLVANVAYESWRPLAGPPLSVVKGEDRIAGTRESLGIGGNSNLPDRPDAVSEDEAGMRAGAGWQVKPRLATLPSGCEVRIDPVHDRLLESALRNNAGEPIIRVYAQVYNSGLMEALT